MTVRAHKNGLSLLSASTQRQVWSYRSSEHILDIIATPGYFASHRKDLSTGDIILVDCPGYYDIERFLGYPPRPVHRPGGGVLQVENKTNSGKLEFRIVGRGLSRFVKGQEDGMSIVPVPQQGDMATSDVPIEEERSA